MNIPIHYDGRHELPLRFDGSLTAVLRVSAGAILVLTILFWAGLVHGTETDVFIYNSRHGQFSLMVNYGSEKNVAVLFRDLSAALPYVLGMETNRKPDEPRYDIFVSCQHLGKAALSLGDKPMVEVECVDKDIPMVMARFARRLGQQPDITNSFWGYTLELGVDSSAKAAHRQAKAWLEKFEVLDSETLSSMFWYAPGYGIALPVWIHKYQDNARFGIRCGIYRTRHEAVKAMGQMPLGRKPPKVMETKFYIPDMAKYFHRPPTIVNPSGKQHSISH